jgi:glycosyltransferase involved in cell wall biosynthesis
VKFGHVVVNDLDETPLISVIIPCYNSGDTIQRSIDSVVNQTWKNIELIIVNDGSDELKTVSVLRNILSGKVFNQLNKGLPSARNFGVSMAQGEYIFFLDADDTIDKDTLTELLAVIKKRNSKSFSFPHMQLMGDRDGKISNKYNAFEQLFFNKIPYSIMISKSFFIEMKGYSEKFIDGYEDWEFNIRLGSNGFLGIDSPKATLYYNVSNSGMLKSKSLNLHGFIWKAIQSQNKSSYNLKSLLRTYNKSKKHHSNYALEYYFLYYMIWKLTPIVVFNMIFKLIKKIN